MNIEKRIKSGDRAASREDTEFAREADRLSEMHRLSWKRALGKIASPAFRLHHYRQAHNRLLQNALCKLDRDDGRDCSA